MIGEDLSPFRIGEVERIDKQCPDSLHLRIIFDEDSLDWGWFGHLTHTFYKKVDK